MKTLVTGACGFIGSHLAERLVKGGYEVTGLARYNAFDSYGWLDECEGMEKVRGDILDAEHIRRLVKGKDIVFHLAALGGIPYSYEAPRNVFEVNAVGTLNILEACRDADAKIVHTSTSEVYGTALYTPQDIRHPLQAQSPYAASKIAADALVEGFSRSFGLESVTLRPFNTYGPRQSERAVIPTIIRQGLGGSIKIGEAATKRDFTYVGDVVEGFIIASRLEGIYQIGSRQNISISELAWRISNMLPEQPKISCESERERPTKSEVWELLCNWDLTEWSPKVSLDDGLQRTIDWWRTRPLTDRGYMT